MSNEGAEDVLSRVRRNNHAERVKKREDMYRKQRNIDAGQSPSTIYSEYKESDIIKAAKNLSSSTRNKERSFAILKNSFIQNPCHMLTFMKVEGALHSLVGYLINQNCFVQLLAIECCCNLSLGDSKTCFKLAKSATPYIVNILQGSNNNLMNIALQTVHNLSGSGKKTWELLYKNGILKVLENAMSQSELRENCVNALIMFVRNGLGDLSVEEILCMINFLQPHFETSDKVQWIMYLFSSLPHINKVLTNTQIPLQTLQLLYNVRQVSPSNIIAVTSWVRLIGNLSAEPSGTTALLMVERWDLTFQVWKYFFLSCRYSHLMTEMRWTLGNILNHKHPELQKKLGLKIPDLEWLTAKLNSKNSS